MALTKSLSFSLGRKRVLISNSCNLDHFSDHYESFSPMKRRRNDHDEGFIDLNLNLESDISLLEALPQEILIKIVCGVGHNDLKQLFHVSKTVRNATVIAKQSHFAYSTPSKIKIFTNSFDSISNTIDFEDCVAPNAPKQDRKNNRAQISRKKLEDISVKLFSNDDEEEQQRWPRRSLFM